MRPVWQDEAKVERRSCENDRNNDRRIRLLSSEGMPQIIRRNEFQALYVRQRVSMILIYCRADF